MSESIKKGDRPIITDLERSGIGLRINVCTHPVIEEFMKHAMGTVEPVIEAIGEYGRLWLPARGESKKDLLVYGIPKELTGVFNLRRNYSYRLDRPGQAIFCPQNDPGSPIIRRSDSVGVSDTLNMSFLRLVGTSDEGGVTFHIGGIHSDELLDKLELLLDMATQEIYSQFLKPIKITVVAEVQDDIAPRQHVVGVEAAEGAA